MDTITILEERGKTHGRDSEHAAITQLTKSLWKAHPGWTRLTPSQCEALDMIAHKVGRVLAGNPHFQDHWDDIAGYAKLVAIEIAGG